eukprot:gb/GECG01004285.1/.p1 GENE.gb/GECG01004285.1/~~gb/GECG01004285.1/.p1  ORF type:complete len:352 (+),score=52.79 gb/GECG01004285.1/:1-1056(+)
MGSGDGNSTVETTTSRKVDPLASDSVADAASAQSSSSTEQFSFELPSGFEHIRSPGFRPSPRFLSDRPLPSFLRDSHKELEFDINAIDSRILRELDMPKTVLRDELGETSESPRLGASCKIIDDEVPDEDTMKNYQRNRHNHTVGSSNIIWDAAPDQLRDRSIRSSRNLRKSDKHSHSSANSKKANLSEKTRAKSHKLLREKRAKKNDTLISRTRKPLSSAEKSREKLAKGQARANNFDDKAVGLKTKRAKSIFLGVYPAPKHRLKWRAQIRVPSVSKNNLFLGGYTSEIEAAMAYDEAVRKYGVNKPVNFSQKQLQSLKLQKEQGKQLTLEATTSPFGAERMKARQMFAQ